MQTGSDAHPLSVKIIFKMEEIGEAKGLIKRFLSPKTVDALLRSLPVKGRAAIWKEEVYFETLVKVGAEKPRSKVDIGDIAYWPLSSAICIFFGKTQPYSPVNLVGKITEGVELFQQVKEGTPITMEEEEA